MRIAFYAPLKPPGHPVPSGDERIARLFVAALEAAGHEVVLAARLRSRDGAGDDARQARLAALGARLAARLVRRWSAGPANRRPDLWFTYHVYHKAPDWIGPAVADALGIPYVIAEASFAPKQAGGPWARGHEAARQAIARADRIVTLNRDDLECLPGVARPGAAIHLPPFLDARPWAAAAAAREEHRAATARALDLDPARPWLLAVAMMREGDKLRSYRMLAEALARPMRAPWQLIVAGDGPAAAAVRRELGALGSDRVRFAGRRDGGDLAALYAAADLFVWPACGEAFGMAILEAEASGLPVVAGRTRGVPDIVTDGEGGLLVPLGDGTAFAAAVDRLAGDPAARAAMGRAAQATVRRHHDIEAAAGTIDRILRPLVARAA